jgi:hypothetical protein
MAIIAAGFSLFTDVANQAGRSHDRNDFGKICRNSKGKFLPIWQKLKAEELAEVIAGKLAIAEVVARMAHKGIVAIRDKTRLFV